MTTFVRKIQNCNSKLTDSLAVDSDLNSLNRLKKYVAVDKLGYKSANVRKYSY